MTDFFFIALFHRMTLKGNVAISLLSLLVAFQISASGKFLFLFFPIICIFAKLTDRIKWPQILKGATVCSQDVLVLGVNRT